MTTTRPGRKRLLIVEDNKVLTTLARKGLENLRYECEIHTAEDGREGIKHAYELRPDLILLDWLMPEFDGRFFLESQRRCEEIAGVPVLIYSLLEVRELEAICQDYESVQGYLHKPIPPSRLAGEIRPFLLGSEAS